jgi:pimeloyl-ACP methyl ester carboxylesterase
MATLVTGLLVLAVGAGLGPRHYASESASFSAIAGFALLATGVGVIVWVSIHLLATVRRRWWAPTLAVLLTATYAALWTLGQAVAAAYPPHPELGERTPTDVGLSYRDVTFSSSDGTRLAGWYVPTRNGAAVALLHGAGSTRSDVLDHAAVLAEHGYGVLLYDARGHGESSGRGMDFGWYGESDVSGAINFLVTQPDVVPTRIGLVGLSMGGEEAIGAAGIDGRVAAVVAEGATNRVAADKGYLARYGTRGELQQRIDRATYWFTRLLTPAPEPATLRRSVVIATARADPTAFLLITAGRVADEALAADYIKQANARDVQTWSIHDADHTQGLRKTPGEWDERVHTFLDDQLNGATR